MSSWSALLQPGCHSERELNSTWRGRKQEVSTKLGVKTWSFYPFPGNCSNSALSDLSLDPHPYSPLGCQWICDQPGQILSIYIHLDYWDSLILVFSWVMLLLKHNENSCVFTTSANFEGFPGGTSGKASTCPCGRWKRLGFDSWVQKIPWRRAWQHPVQYSYLENPMDRGAWKATVCRVTKSWSWLSGWARMLARISSAWGGSVQGTLCCRAPVHALRAIPLLLCWEGETISQSFSWWLLLFMWTLMGCLHLFFFFGYTHHHSVQFSRSVMSDSLRPHGLQHDRLPCPSPILEPTQTHVCRVSDAIQPSHSLLSPSLPAFDLSQHQDLFQWVSSSHQVAKVLEFQLQHQFFQWIFRTDFL